MDDLLDDLYDAIVAGRADDAVDRTRSGIDQGIEPVKLLYDGMVPALEEVGTLFEEGRYFLPEMLTAAHAMQAAMDLVRPHIADVGRSSIGTVVMGTIAGDIHDIGKNICSVMLQGAGFEVIDLGVNVPAADFVAAIREHRPDLVGMSAFLTTTMPEIGTTIELITAQGLRNEVKIMVGGAPINDQVAGRVGADGYAPDASSAARLAKQLLG